MNANNTTQIFAKNDSSMVSETSDNHLLILEDDQGRKEFPLDRLIYSIGRDRDCDIRLVSQFVSRRHATLVRLRDDKSRTDYYRIVDGDAKGKSSSNGLMINGRKMPAHDLKNEDEIVFGPQVRAIYYLLQRDAVQPVPTDSSEYDITLINPSMTEDIEEIDD
jgi:pSer/pThr/pTyr-binding forkhead associated (FHA) protein